MTSNPAGLPELPSTTAFGDSGWVLYKDPSNRQDTTPGHGSQFYCAGLPSDDASFVWGYTELENGNPNFSSAAILIRSDHSYLVLKDTDCKAYAERYWPTGSGKAEVEASVKNLVERSMAQLASDKIDHSLYAAFIWPQAMLENVRDQGWKWAGSLATFGELLEVEARAPIADTLLDVYIPNVQFDIEIRQHPPENPKEGVAFLITFLWTAYPAGQVGSKGNKIATGRATDWVVPTNGIFQIRSRRVNVDKVNEPAKFTAIRRKLLEFGEMSNVPSSPPAGTENARRGSTTSESGKSKGGSLLKRLVSR
ncbi:hypothetical protein T439DRAFT_329532, partial [Meredithblackwellia eburnea MCA 4105]